MFIKTNNIYTNIVRFIYIYSYIKSVIFFNNIQIIITIIINKNYIRLCVCNKIKELINNRKWEKIKNV